MKKLLGATLATLFLVLNAQAQTLSQADRDRALQYLETTSKNIVDATRGLSEAQWNFKPSPFRWSVAQVLEHIAASEDFLRGIEENRVLKAPPAPDRDIKQLDEKVLATVPDRALNKASAPAPLRPTNRYGSPDAALKSFLESRGKTIELLKRDDLRAHAVDSPLGGKLDGYEWLLVIAAHSERHTKQLNEVKADPKFPKQ